MPKLTGALLLLLAGSWVGLASLFDGAAWLLLWPATAFAGAGLGYVGLGARVFGKRADGTVAWPVAVVMAPYLAVGWAGWRLFRLGPEDACNRVAPWLWLGRRPARGELPPDVTAVVDLTAEFPVDRVELGARGYLGLPTLDGHVPSHGQLADLVARAHAHGGVLYVHCAYGHGRSALVAAALLLARGEAESAEGAVARLRAVRPGVRLSRSQRAALDRIAGPSTLPEARS
jgi:protein-tyrosine phosphatase